VGAHEALMRRYMPPSGDRILREDASSADRAEIRSELERWILVDSGTSALALAVLDVVEKSRVASPQVIVPAYCCPQVLSAVHFAGAEPVLVDFEPESVQLDLADLAAAMTSNIVAVVAINFCGVHERIGDIASVVADRAALIYDCCQWFPPERSALPAADYVTFSFGRGKPVSVFHGGALVSRNPLANSVASRIRPSNVSFVSRLKHSVLLSLYAIARHRAVFPLLDASGLAGRTHYRAPHAPRYMNAHAAVLLPINIKAFRSRSSRAAERIAAALHAPGSAYADLADTRGQGSNSELSRYPLLAPTTAARDGLIARFRAAGIGASSLYGDILPNIAGVVIKDVRKQFSAALELAHRLVTLPVHSDVTEYDLDAIDIILREWAGSPSPR
jgi:dTDP-4-amino-4,6-dideoxygalactose transaminase